MKIIFGVSSTTPANKKLKNGYTLYEWIMRQKCFPRFWGRTILGEDSITDKEIEYLKSKDCKILPIMQDLSEEAVSGINGAEDALRAINAAESLGIPKNEGIAIFAKIEPEWSINHNWMINYASNLFYNGYVSGFIGNTDSSKNFNFDRQCSHFIQATEAINHYNAVLMANEPKFEEMPIKWAPYCPSVLRPEDMDLWACSKTVFDDVVADDIYATDENILKCMW